MSKKDSSGGSGRKMVSILPSNFRKSPIKVENENTSAQTIFVSTIDSDVKTLPTSPPDKIAPQLQKGQLQKTILEAFIKVIGCRKVTVQTLSLDGKVLHSDVEEVEGEPEIIHISKQEKVNETVSKFLVSAPEQYELKDTILGKTNFTTSMSIKCPTFTGNLSSSSTPQKLTSAGANKDKNQGQEALEVLDTMVQFAMRKKTNTPSKAIVRVLEEGKEDLKISSPSRVAQKNVQDIKTVAGHQTRSSIAENKAHKSDESKKGDESEDVRKTEKMDILSPKKNRSKKSLKDRMDMAGDNMDDSLIFEGNHYDMIDIFDAAGDQVSLKGQADDSKSSPVTGPQTPDAELLGHVDKPRKRGRPRKTTPVVENPEPKPETGNKRRRKPTWKCLEMQKMKEIDDDGNESASYPSKIRISKETVDNKDQLVCIKQEPKECADSQLTMPEGRTRRHTVESSHGSDEAFTVSDGMNDIAGLDDMNATDEQDASDEFEISDDFDFSIFDDDVYEKKYGGKKETVMLSCPYCPKKYEKKPAYRKHIRKHKKELNIKKDVCDVCKKEFDNENAFKAHVLTHKDQTENGRFKCSSCGKDYSSRGGLLKHLRSDKKCKIDTYKCDYCFNVFANSESLEIHMRKHSKTPPERMYLCPKCDKSFETAGGLNKHKRNKACEIKLKCDHCPKVFSNHVLFQKHCRKHIRAAAEGAVCEECGKKFSSAIALKSHQNTHMKIRNFKCEVCGKGFYMKGTMVSHMRIHTGERPYLCVYCGAGFRYNCHLKMHTRIHTGEKPYNCTECERSFQSKQSLKKHLVSHERIRQKSLSKLETMNIEVKQEYIDITDVNGATEEIVFVNALEEEGEETTTQYIYTTEDGQHIQGYLANDDAQQVVFQTMEGENVTVLNEVETSDLNILAETAESYDASNVTYVIVKK